MRTVHRFTLAAGLLALAFTSSFAQQKGTFKDIRDKKVYKTVKIGEQTWMAQNMDYAGANDDIGACYDTKPANCKKYGALYSWDEAMKVCPEGWHLPSKEEWQVLVDFVGGDSIAGKKLKVKSGWTEWKCKYEEKTASSRGNITVTKHDKCNTDEFGFAALPGGLGPAYGVFFEAGQYGHWWGSSESDADHVYLLSMDYNNEKAKYGYYGKKYLYSVRCLQDSKLSGKENNPDSKAVVSAQQSTFKDARDGKTYKTVKIGEQNWMAENLNYNAKGSKCYGEGIRVSLKPAEAQANCEKWGRLYDWKTATKACPSGWHLPKDKELQKLIDFAGGEEVAGKKLKSASGWEGDGNGTDDFGFSALPGGDGDAGEGLFSVGAGHVGGWWGASENTNGASFYGMSSDENLIYDNDTYKGTLISVRCLKN